VIAAPEVGWATTSPTVATVTASGLVTGVTNGEATIVATYEGVAALSAITVTGVGGPNPGSPETCDGVDNDLDREIDEGLRYCVDGVAAPNTDGSACLPGFEDANSDSADGCEHQLAQVLTFASISAGSGHSCGLTSAGTAHCWGYNRPGAPGDGTMTDRLTPVAVAGGLSFAGVSAGSAHTCGVISTGVAYCWGFNLWGQLGDGTTTDRLTPVTVSMPTGVVFQRASTGRFYTCALMALGSAYC
jgi:hypothetical protein